MIKMKLLIFILLNFIITQLCFSQSQDAILKALSYLYNTQHTDGYWEEFVIFGILN